jgi:hypothetical protein
MSGLLDLLISGPLILITLAPITPWPMTPMHHPYLHVPMTPMHRPYPLTPGHSAPIGPMYHDS